MTTLRSASVSPRSGLPNLAFLKPDFEILASLTHLAFFENQKTPETSGFFDFFQSERLGPGKTLSELHIHYKSLLTKVYDPAGWKEYCKDFTVALKMLNSVNKKQMYDSVIKRKENASKDWNCIISIFPTSSNIHFAFGYACFMCICLMTAIWLFWWRQDGSPAKFIALCLVLVIEAFSLYENVT